MGIVLLKTRSLNKEMTTNEPCPTCGHVEPQWTMINGDVNNLPKAWDEYWWQGASGYVISSGFNPSKPTEVAHVLKWFVAWTRVTPPQPLVIEQREANK